MITAALYVRISTTGQTVENQRRELEAAAAQRGWRIVAIYSDEGVSGAQGRDKRPGLDALLKDAVRGRFNVIMCWAVDRMGRSLPDLISTMQTLHGAKVDLFLHQQAIDTTTAAGRAMFGLLGVFAEFERSMIQTRVQAGLQRAQAHEADPKLRAARRAAGKRALGRPTVSHDVTKQVRAKLAAGVGILRVAKEVGCGVSVVQRVKREI